MNPIREDRSMHLVDVENLMGGTQFLSSDVTAIEAQYRELAGIKPGDHVVIGSSHFTAGAVWFGWSHARRVVRSGPDGADLALIRLMDEEDLAGRYGRVVVGSGDGIFAEPCARLQALECPVTVVARCPASLSRRLAFAVRDTHFLEPTVPVGSVPRMIAA